MGAPNLLPDPGVI